MDDDSVLKPPRDHSLDIMKAIGITAVVVGHVLMYSRPVENAPLITHSLTIIYLFNVQAFAFVSGYLSTRFDPVRRARTVLVPLAAWIVLYALSGLSDVPGAIRTFFIAAVQGQSNLWFLWALFGGLIILGLYDRFPRTLIALSLLWGLAWTYIPATTAIRTVGYVLPFIVLGRTMRTYEDAHGRIPSGHLIAASLLFVEAAHLLIFHPQLGLTPGQPQTLLKAAVLLTASVAACLTILGISRLVRGRAVRTLAFVGTMSIGIYGFNSLLILRFLEFFQTTRLWEIPVRIIVLMAASMALAWLVGRSRILSVLLLGGRVPAQVSTRRPGGVRDESTEANAA